MKLTLVKMATIAKSLASTITLNDGLVMPLFGLGLYLSAQGQGGEAEKAVDHALRHGYRLIDTAEFYGNEADVGRGVKRSGLKREDVFVVTKLWDNGYEKCRDHFTASLKKLDIGYVDLYLIHSPGDGKVVESYKAMLEFKEKGLIKSCGVSNFGPQHLEGLERAGMPRPSVNQIEIHPWFRRDEIVKKCRDLEVAIMGYSPLVKGQRFGDPTIQALAKKLKKTEAQIMIRYSVQNGYITIPKSANPKRIEENADVFDWSIPQEDMDVLNSLPESGCTWNPCVSKWVD